jgi:hypothetical protein
VLRWGIDHEEGGSGSRPGDNSEPDVSAGTVFSYDLRGRADKKRPGTSEPWSFVEKEDGYLVCACLTVLEGAT